MSAKARFATLDWTLSFAEYTPAELARISGLSADMQRVWRRRQYLPALGAGQRAKFSPHEAIEITIRYALSRLGIPPNESAIVGDEAISGALYHALLGHDGSCEVIGPAREVAIVVEDACWAEHAFLLAGRPEATNYLIWSDEDSVEIVDDVQKVFERRTVSLVAIDLSVIGARLVERCRKPLITLEAPEEQGAPRVRRLTGIGANDV